MGLLLGLGGALSARAQQPDAGGQPAGMNTPAPTPATAEPAGAAPYATGAAGLLLNARPEAGLLTLYSGYRNHPLIDAEAMVWMGESLNAGLGNDSDADVLTINIGVREPHGYGSARIGRLIVASGAIRPVQMDGVRLLARAPFGTSVESFAGVPVRRGLGGGSDWLVGGRVAQQLWQDRIGLGASYVHQRDAGMVANEEVGADLVVHPLDHVWLRALSSWDLSLAGLALAQAELMVVDGGLSARVYGERRVAARMLPSTSLFSTISDSANSEVGSEGDYQLFPRLSVGGRVALQFIDEAHGGHDYGYRLSARSRLRLGDADEGDVLLTLSRLGGYDYGYSAAYLAVERALGPWLRAHAAGELVGADESRGRGALWPYVNVGLRAQNDYGWTVAAGLIARATPEFEQDLTALVRVGFQESASP